MTNEQSYIPGIESVTRPKMNMSEPNPGKEEQTFDSKRPKMTVRPSLGLEANVPRARGAVDTEEQ